MKKKYLMLIVSVYTIALLGAAGYKVAHKDLNYAGYKKHIETAKTSYKVDNAFLFSSNVDDIKVNEEPAVAVQNSNAVVETKTPAPESVVQNNAANSTAKEAPKNNFTKELKKGDSGEEVKLLQKLLKEKGFFKNDITGNMGDATIDALKAFEKSIKVTVDGVLDTKTASKLIE